MGVGARKRKLQSTLYNSGLAFLVLGFWSALKGCVTIFLDYRAEIESMIREQLSISYKTLSAEELEMMEVIAFWMLVALVAIFVALALLFHFLIGRAAMKEAKEKKKGKAYLVFAVIYIGFVVLTYVSNIMYPESVGFYDISEIIFDVTLIFADILIIKSALQLRKIAKEEAAGLAA